MLHQPANAISHQRKMKNVDSTPDLGPTETPDPYGNSGARPCKTLHAPRRRMSAASAAPEPCPSTIPPQRSANRKRKFQDLTPERLTPERSPTLDPSVLLAGADVHLAQVPPDFLPAAGDLARLEDAAIRVPIAAVQRATGKGGWRAGKVLGG